MTDAGCAPVTSALRLDMRLQPCASRIPEFQLRRGAARAGARRAWLQLLVDAQTDVAAVASSVEDGGVKLAGLPRLTAPARDPGAGRGAALDEPGQCPFTAFLEAQSADLN
jgi:chromosome segregation protein